ncbi:uncharacterized protein LOC129609522 [Condylostylus longicornis]|uniref:uncharacterized protein LOC129609522 n=1 Tax=Condylostylus longicornis TaxID=2530218 RepID=UPI00244DBBB2|nr:uncharacterized protein LOC129609522 [Condylostylus longicornis]
MGTKMNKFVFYILIIGIITIIQMNNFVFALKPRGQNFQYFERPSYRYPYYDENGRGKLLYGYGGPDLYTYKAYTPLEGIH